MDITIKLVDIGLSNIQIEQVIKVIDSIPIKIMPGISNTKCSIVEGVVFVEPNKEDNK